MLPAVVVVVVKKKQNIKNVKFKYAEKQFNVE